MTDDRRPPNADAVDPGPPIEALARLREEPSPVFGVRVLDAINRRILGVQAMDVPYWGFSRLLLEYVQLILGLFGVKDDDEADDRKEN
jgi:hypothetical protein